MTQLLLAVQFKYSRQKDNVTSFVNHASIPSISSLNMLYAKLFNRLYEDIYYSLSS